MCNHIDAVIDTVHVAAMVEIDVVYADAVHDDKHDYDNLYGDGKSAPSSVEKIINFFS